jgi:hypothetical protein
MSRSFPDTRVDENVFLQRMGLEFHRKNWVLDAEMNREIKWVFDVTLDQIVLMSNWNPGQSMCPEPWRK